MKRSAWRYLWMSEDIRKKLIITILLLIIYRLAANIPVPGIDREVIRLISESNTAGASLLNLIDMLSGGTISKFSILAMGVYPYITAQIIIQLLVPIIPALDRRLKDNPREGRVLMEKWTTMLTIPMAFLSAIGQVNIFNTMLQGRTVLTSPFGFTGESLIPTLTLLTSMVAGTMFGIWLGQMISEFGIPKQGLSLIIFAGIISQIPFKLAGLLADKVNGWWMFLMMIAILGLTIFAIVYVQQGRRNVPVLFPGRRVGNRMSMPVRSNLPLLVNMAGMIPLIFAQTFLSFPALIASYFVAGRTEGFFYSVMTLFGGQGWFYPILYFVLVVAFSFFYTDVLFTQQNYGETLKKQGAQIPGVIRGGPTQKYLSKVQRRITFPGAFFLGFVAVLPYILGAILPVAQSTLFVISAAGLLIVVGVVRDTFTIIETELKVHGYDESIIKG
ncbi:MAG: preprotein translocase subunit SecY [Chloroflexi bacterium]|nr:MAG: preprotein translocase subunit SecY [Chloroflexota bacterium]MBA4374621.1 preprotein translocase subunit SecY [Anaerolinea sp.]